MQKGNSIIPGSKSPAHLADNLDIFDFELTDDEMAEIAKLAEPGKTYYSADESVNEILANVIQRDDFIPLATKEYTVHGLRRCGRTTALDEAMVLEEKEVD